MSMQGFSQRRVLRRIESENMAIDRRIEKEFSLVKLINELKLHYLSATAAVNLLL